MIFCPTYNDMASKWSENGFNIPPFPEREGTHTSLFEAHLHVWRASILDEGLIEILQGLIPPEPPNTQQVMDKDTRIHARAHTRPCTRPKASSLAPCTRTSVHTHRNSVSIENAKI